MGRSKKVQTPVTEIRFLRTSRKKDMATLTPSRQTTNEPVPQAIGQRLQQLRRRIKRFVLVDGFSRILAVIVGLVLLDLMIDRVFKMDVAQRVIVLWVIVGVVLLVAFRRLLRPLSRKVGDDALVLQVEQQNKSLGESLISTVQFSRERQHLASRGYADSLVDETIRRGSQMAESIDFNRTIDAGLLGRNLILLLACLMAMIGIGFAVSSTDLWRTWFNRNILLSDDQWPRNTQLQLVGVSDGVLVLPRGEDYRQFVEVKQESRISDVEVSIEFDDGNTRTQQKMRRTGKLDDREHMLVFRDILREFRFRAIGGDDTTEWVQVNLVDSPMWSELDLTAIPPEYTGVKREVLPPGGGPYSILEGSALQVSAVANKPLSEAVLRQAEQQWSLQADADGRYSLTVPARQFVGGKYLFDLADESGLRSSRPAVFTVTTRPDRPPRTSASLLGISGMVVSRVRVPVLWNAADEYSIQKVEFVYDWSSDTPGSVPQSGSIDLSTLGSETAALIGSTEIKTVDVLDLEPLQIPAGVGLNLAVSATDNNTLTGPGVGESRKFLLRVVTEDELRADLLRREIEQRKIFELILKSQEEMQVDLRALAALLGEPNPEIDDNSIAEDMLGWQRRQKLVGTNISAVADRFEEYLVEVKNNRLDEAESEIDSSRSIEVRFHERIIEPIRKLDSTSIVEASQLLEQASRTTGDHKELATGLTATADHQTAIIEAMRKILLAMEDSETYQEVVNLAIEIKDRENRLREMAREQIEKANTEDVFDDQPPDDTSDNDPDKVEKSADDGI